MYMKLISSSVVADQERRAGILRIDINELHEERYVKENRFRVRQAQHQRTLKDRACRFGATFVSIF